MGKNKTKRFGAMKPNPTGIVSEKELDLEAELTGDHDSVPSSISNIVEKVGADQRRVVDLFLVLLFHL